MALSPVTIAKFQALDAMVWFRAVGQGAEGDIALAEDWEEAMDWNSQGIWEDVQLEGANQIRDAIGAKSVARYQGWNLVVASVRPLIENLVQEKVRAIVLREKLDKAFVDSVQWDMLHLAMETEYSDLIAPGFFTRLSEWYEKGHWPCGWDGTLEAGRQVVF